MLFTIENHGVNGENYHIGIGSVNKEVTTEYFGNENQYEKAVINLTVENKPKGKELTPEEKKDYYLTINAMFNMAKYANGLKKGTVVFFISKWKEETYNDKTYIKDELLFITKMTGNKVDVPSFIPNELAPVPDDDGLPF
jgi:hypothetical protein